MPSENVSRAEWFQIGSAIITPLVVALLGIWIQYTVAQSSAAVSYVEIGTRILSDPMTASNDGLRLWAIELLEAYSSVALPVDLRKSLVSGETTLPDDPGGYQPRGYQPPGWIPRGYQPEIRDPSGSRSSPEPTR